MSWRFCFDLPSGQRVCIPIYVVIKKWRDHGDPWIQIVDELRDPSIPVQFREPEASIAVQDLVRLSAIAELASSLSQPELGQQFQSLATDVGQKLAGQFLPDAELHTHFG